MAKPGWETVSRGFSRLLCSGYPGQKDTGTGRPRVWAIVPPGTDRNAICAACQEAGWTITLSAMHGALPERRGANGPPVIIYDPRMSPHNWPTCVKTLTKASPRPYLILLSPNTDANLWDELQRIGGSDILRTPVTREGVLSTVKLALRFLDNQRRVRSPTEDPC